MRPKPKPKPKQKVLLSQGPVERTPLLFHGPHPSICQNLGGPFAGSTSRGRAVRSSTTTCRCRPAFSPMFFFFLSVLPLLETSFCGSHHVRSGPSVPSPLGKFLPNRTIRRGDESHVWPVYLSSNFDVFVCKKHWGSEAEDESRWSYSSVLHSSWSAGEVTRPGTSSRSRVCGQKRVSHLAQVPDEERGPEATFARRVSIFLVLAGDEKKGPLGYSADRASVELSEPSVLPRYMYCYSSCRRTSSARVIKDSAAAVPTAVCLSSLQRRGLHSFFLSFLPRL